MLVDGPGDAWLLCRMATWAAILPVLKHLIRLDTLADVMWRDPQHAPGPGVDKIMAFSRLLARPVTAGGGTCFERGLLAYRFLSESGADPRLVIAVKSADSTITGHAWVTVGGAAVGEADTLAEFVPVVAYGRGGRREELSARP